MNLKKAALIGVAVLAFVTASAALVICRALPRGYLAGILPTAGPALESIVLPPGFRIHMYAANVPGARSLALSPSGTLYVGTRPEGRVYAIVDRDRDFRADEVRVIAAGLHSPNGVAFRGGALYVAEVSAVHVYEGIEEGGGADARHRVIRSDFPTDDHHGWKYIAFGPDGMLYVPVGAPCNVCRRDDRRYASIMRMHADGSGLELFAQGIRNTVGFDWNPLTRELWFTDNGRDWMGDDAPPDELNRAPRAGMHFGFPFCHGKDLRDPEFGEGAACASYTPPEMELDAHAAALGMKFYTGSMFPARYRGNVFIAQHGSWNRSEPIGYRIEMVRIENGRAVGREVFARGWLQGSAAWGRPVDVLVMPDGSLLVSDDKAGAIYRIHYTGE
ncbi:MAG: sorbosone dehydrogenase family protein [Spirochaetes bacterium]|nr:MAG: sorbosone dehydrogenase family protein [Spirochaetota bacterium]